MCGRDIRNWLRKLISKFHNHLSAEDCHSKKSLCKGLEIYFSLCSHSPGTLPREPLLVPHKYSNEIIADSFYQSTHASSDEEMSSFAHYEPPEDDFLSLIHVALKIRRELIHTPGHQGFEVSDEVAVSCVLDSLYMFLNVL